MTPADLVRAIRRAVEAEELSDSDIAAEIGCSREYVSRVRARLCAERRTRIARAADRRRSR